MAQDTMKVVKDDSKSKLDEAIQAESKQAEKEPEMTEAQRKKEAHEQRKQMKAYRESIKKELLEEAEMFEVETRRMTAEMHHFEVRQEFLRFSEEREKERAEEAKKMKEEQEKAEKKSKSKIIQPTPEQVSKLGK